MTEFERLALAFEEFELSTHDPKWSSWLLDRLFEANLVDAHNQTCDLVRGFDLALHRNNIALTGSVAHLIREVGVRWVGRHREFYAKSTWDRARWDWARTELDSGVGAARAYLYLSVMPSNQMNPTSVAAILLGLEGSPEFEQAVVELAEDLESPAVRHELQALLTNGSGDRITDRIQSLLAAH